MPAITFPKPMDHLRRGEAARAKVGRAARTLVGSFKSLARRRSVAKYYATRHAFGHYLLIAFAEEWNERLAKAGWITAAIYLRDVVKAPAEHIAKYASAFGTKAAKAHRELFGSGPCQDGLTVIGTNRPRLTVISTFGPHARAALEKAVTTHKATAALPLIGA